MKTAMVPLFGLVVLAPVLAIGFAASGGRTVAAIAGALLALAMLRRKRRF